jgi:exopolysaccharide biosynthesis polyprenyl glycosylphosphotransferase
MLKENWRFISRLQRIGDLLLIAVAFVLAYYGRESAYFWNATLGLALPLKGPELAPMQDYFSILMVALFGYAVLFQFSGAYSSMRLQSPLRLIWLALMSSVAVFLLVSTTIFLLKLDLSRGFVILFCGLVTLLFAAQRYIVLAFLRFWRRRGINFRNVLICGAGFQAIQLAREIHHHPELGIRVRGYVDLSGALERGSKPLLEFKKKLFERGCGRVSRVIRGLDGLERALREYAIDEVLFTDVTQIMSSVEEAVLMCSEQGVQTTIAADLFSFGMLGSRLSYFGGLPLIHFQTPPGDDWRLLVKRWMDLLGAGLLLLLLAPVFFGIALIIKFTSRGPVLFVQRRVGKHGRLFDLYKFRSMKPGAERELEMLKAQNEMTGPVFKMKNDPRVTRIGRILRRYSIDELPQLWNVLKGDMSLVGPRPPVPGEVSLYNRKDRRRLSMRPGITCSWQVKGRNDIPDFETWVEMDLEYIDNWSLGRDFVLLAQTIPAVFSGSGAR